MDGSGGLAGTSRASGVYSIGPTGRKEKFSRSYLGPLASVADVERQAITLALVREVGMVVIASDRAAAISSVRKLSRGSPPRSGIEARIKAAILGRDGEVGILCVRGHCSIPGNEIADHLANMYSEAGLGDADNRVATEEQSRERGRALWASWRNEFSFGLGRTDWGTHALAAFTWLRTNRGPQWVWLHKIGKADSQQCRACDHPSEDGTHITFHSSSLAQERGFLLGGRTGWAELDHPHWIELPLIPEKEADMVDGVEEFFRWFSGTRSGGAGSKTPIF